MDFGRIIEAYMHHCHSRQLRPKTMLSYEQTRKLFGVWLADTTAVTRVEDIREKHIRAYIVELQERGKYTQVSDRKAQKYNCPQNRRDYCAKISNTTINNYVRNLKAYFAWLVDMEMLSISPLRRVKPLPEERKPKEYMDDDEVKRLLKCMDKSYYAEYRDMIAILLMLDAGTRLSETLTIEVEAVDLSEQTVVLPADKTKGRKERTVFFSDRTAKELRRWMQFKDRYCESPYLLPVKSTGRVLCLCDFEKNFRKYVQRAGIKKKVSPHTLRNNFARRCLMAGMDIYTLSRILGHSSVTVTEKAYLDIADKELMTKYRIMRSPMKKVQELPQQRPAKEYLTDDEVQRLFKVMDCARFSEYRDMLVMMLMLDAGMRLGETLSAETEQLNLETHSLYLPADKTKGRKARTVYFSDKTAKTLKRWLQFKDRYCDSPFLFPVRYSGQKVNVSNYETNFAKYIKRAGIEKRISPHTLRNNFANTWTKINRNEEVCMAILNKICAGLGISYGDIIEYIPVSETNESEAQAE